MKKNIVEKKERPGLKVGDYINYKPDTAEGKTYSLLGAQSGYISNQTIAKEILNWRILKINGDGSIDIISNPTSNSVYFQGALGYNNGVYLLNDICKELYSNTTKGVTARSVNLKDMEDCLTDVGKIARDECTSNGNIKYGKSKMYIDNYSYTPDAYNSEEDENSSHYTSPTTKTATRLGTLNAKQTFYYISINSSNYGNKEKVLNNSNSYWVAARYMVCNSDFANFGLRYADTNISGNNMFLSSDNSNSNNNRIRAVVSLGPDVKINANTGDSPANAHTIEW